MKDRLIENRARITLFPDREEENKLSRQLQGIAEALEIPFSSKDEFVNSLKRKRILRVLDVGIGRGTDTPLVALARLSENGLWLFPSESLVGIDYNKEPWNFVGLYTFQSANVLEYTSDQHFDIIYAKGVLSSGFEVEASLKWNHKRETPEVFIAIQRLLSPNENAVIILDKSVWGEYILLTDEQAHQYGLEVVESASILFHDEQLKKKFESRGKTGKMYSKLVLKRKTNN